MEKNVAPEQNDTEARKEEIIQLTKTLINAISLRDCETYLKLTDANPSCFEPETMGDLVEGLDFHKFFFNNLPKLSPEECVTTMVNPLVHLLSDDIACIAYTRLRQTMTGPNSYQTAKSNETRVWVKKNGNWRVVHVHRSNSTI